MQTSNDGKRPPHFWLTFSPLACVNVCVLGSNVTIGRIRDESAVHALKIKEVDTRIEAEIAGLRTSIQSAKFNVLQVSFLLPFSTNLGMLTDPWLTDHLNVASHSVVSGGCGDRCRCPPVGLSPHVPLNLDLLAFCSVQAVMGQSHGTFVSFHSRAHTQVDVQLARLHDELRMIGGC